MKILFKYATRERPNWFQQTLTKYFSMLSHNNPHQFIISLDEDDKTMNHDGMQSWMRMWDYCLSFHYGNNKNKIEAINNDIYNYDWDILVVVSDDMIPVIQDFDKVICSDMQKYYPNLDGALHYNDDFCGGNRTITLSIMGRELYRQLGYVYHPDYKSFFCDNEFTEVVRKMNKVQYIDKVIISHKSWHGGGNSADALYKRNSKMGAPDEATYNKRKAKGFPKCSVLH